MKVCSKGHRILDEDVLKSKGQLLPCGCPVTSADGLRAAGLQLLKAK